MTALSPELPRSSADQPSSPTAATRILRATVHLLVERGAAQLSLHDAAELAGVSKGLIHYHYHDKETLLTRAVEWIAAELTRREQRALAESTPRRAVDDLWLWLSEEVRRGHVRVLLELAQEPSALVREAVHAAALTRRRQAAVTVTRLFKVLELSSRVPAYLLGEVVVAFVDGLALNARVLPEQDPRGAFDVFWLGVLSLAE